MSIALPASRMRAVAAALAVASTLAACASTTRVAPAPASPAVDAMSAARWTNATTTRSAPADDATLAAWWRGFDDPVLATLVTRTLERNTDVRIARAAVAQSRAARAVTAAGAQPQVRLTGSAGANRDDSRTTRSSSAGFGASWEPDLFGATSAGIAAGDADIDATVGDAVAVRTALAAEVTLDYLAWHAARARLDITRTSLTRLEELRQLTEWRVRAGLATSLDDEQARLGVEQARASVQALATTIAQLEHQLARLGAQAIGEVRALLADTPAQMPQAQAAIDALAIGVPTDLLRRRPDLRAAEARVRSQWAQREQARLDRLPSLSLSASLGVQALSLSLLSGGATGAAALATAFAWPIVDAGAGAARVDAQNAALDAARTRYQAAVRTALMDVEDGVVALESARTSLDAQTQAADAASNVLLLTRNRYDAGLVDMRVLLQAERDALAAQTSLVDARADLGSNLVRLVKSLGGGWSDADVVALSSSRTEEARQP